MKKRIVNAASIILVLTIIFSGCKKEDKNINPAASGIITTGQWSISSYHETGEDHTNDFAGYTFTFDSNGQMTTSISSGTITGSWSIDDSENELHMDLGNTSPLDKLSKGWPIVSITENEISLQDDNASNNEELHFVKL